MQVPQCTTQFVKTNVEERKLTKTRMLKNKQFYFIKTGQLTNKQAVRFINIAMYSVGCVCMSNKNIFSQE